MEIDASNLSGQIRIRNRHGGSSLRLEGEPGNSRIQVDSVSGAVNVTLEEPTQTTTTAVTACGTIAVDLPGDVDVSRVNSRQLLVVTTGEVAEDRALSAQVVLRSECGDITISGEK